MVSDSIEPFESQQNNLPSYYPRIPLDGVKSEETEYEWKSYTGSKLTYIGTLGVANIRLLYFL